MEIKASDEQINILNAFKNNENISVIAVAGSGKTTTILTLATNSPEKNFLVLTYNRRLSDSTKDRIKEYKINNVEMHTYHAFCNKYYGECRNDEMMFKYLNTNSHNPTQLKNFNVLIIDEMQDMNELYYKFIKNKLSHLIENIQMVLLGDPRQTIYQFNGGDYKYLVNPVEYWNRPFTKCYMETTYRLPSNVVTFVNTLIASKYPEAFKIKKAKKTTENPVEYHFIDVYRSGKNTITKIIKQYGLENILLIAHSVKDKTPINKCLNDLSKSGINMCVLRDEDMMDHDIIQGKLLASTIHKQKGCEKKCVVLYGLDCSYHKYYGHGKPLSEWMNLIYVALTRSLEKLIIIGDKKHGFLKNWHRSEIDMLVNNGVLKVYGFPNDVCGCKLENKCQCDDKPNKVVNVVDIIQHRRFIILNNFVYQPSVKITEIKGTQPQISCKDKVTMNNGLMENVSCIYGVMIPIIVEYALYKRIKMIEYIISDQFTKDFENTKIADQLNGSVRGDILKTYYKLEHGSLQDLIDKFLVYFAFLSVRILCYDSYIYLINQIDNYDWIDKQYVQECCQRLESFKKNLSESSDDKSEFKINKLFDMSCIHPEHRNVKFSIYGRVDDLIDNGIIEYKVTKNVGDLTHMSQLLIYMWIMKKSIGYLYYPSHDVAIKISINNNSEFSKFDLSWLNNLCKEYYQLMLKSI